MRPTASSRTSTTTPGFRDVVEIPRTGLLKARRAEADDGSMDKDDFLERRSGGDRRRNAPPRNGLAILMAGCSECDRIAPPPAVMHEEGWLIESDDLGLVRITCPAHLNEDKDKNAIPDYLVFADETR